MRIYCDSLEVFEGQEYKGLERLLMRVRLGQHELLIDDLAGFFDSRFFLQAVAPMNRPEVRELLERQIPALADRSADPAARAPGPRAELVPVALRERTCWRHSSHPVWEIDPSTAGEWSESPLRLLLENDNDWQLVEAAARVYDRPKAVDSMRNKFLLMDQRGGKTEVKKAVETCSLAERVFVLMDSDRMTPSGQEDKPQRDIRDLVKTTRPNVLPFILAKREVENYLPAEVWQHAVEVKRQRQSYKKPQEAKEQAKKLRAWLELSNEVKDTVDLEKYFPDAKQQVQKLCDNTLVPDAKTLESRAGDELERLLNELEVWL